MALWKTLPIDIPSDAQTVWVRVKYYYSKPFLAVFSASTNSFTSVTNSILYPGYVIARWKAQ